MQEMNRPSMSSSSRNLRFGMIDLVRGTRTVSLLKELEETQFLPPDEIRARQEALLDDYVGKLRRASPLYRGLPDFSAFPIIEKDFVYRNRNLLMNPEYRGKIFRKKTGGSTGEPLIFDTSALAQSHLWAGLLLSWTTAGYRPSDPVVFLAGSSVFGSGYKQSVYYKLMNVRFLTAYNLSPEVMTSYVDTIANGGFRLIFGYATAIHEVALHVLRRPRRPSFSLRGIVCTAEVLTEAMRETIEAAFGASCFNQYGCHEAGVSAYECEEKKGLHLITTRSYHEVQEDGRLISTDLSNDAFFLPRYDTGDLVVMSDQACSCGRGFPLIREVIGRRNDVVRDKSGKVIHHCFFVHLFRHDPRIVAFQVLFDRDRIAILLRARVNGNGWPEYTAAVRSAMQFDELLIIEDRPFIHTSGGKRRYVVQVEDVGEALATATAE